MKSTLLVFLFFFAFCAWSQFDSVDQLKVDSLHQLRKSSNDKLVLSKSLLQLSEWYSMVSIDSVLHYAASSKKIAEPILKQVKNQERKKEFEKVIAGADNNIAYSYFNKGEFPQALHYNKLALDRWKHLKEDEGVVRSLNNIGAIYRQLEDFPKALKFYEEALQYNLKEGNAATIAITYNNLGSIYKTLDRNQKSMECYRKSLFYRQKAKDKRGEANTLNNIGSLYKKLGKIDSASFYFNSSFALIQEVGDPIGIAHASSNVGDIALERSDFATAERLGKQALKIGQESEMLMIIEQSSALLERVYQRMGKWKLAYEMQKLHAETSLKIKSQEANKAAEMLAMQYAYEQQKEIDKIINDKKLAIAQKEQHVQRITIWFVVGISLFVIVLLFILYERYQKVNQQKGFIEKQNNERKILLQEIHHRVKNNFQIISSLLKLQSHQEDNPKLQKSFQDAINRIHSMATVHEIIYKQDSLAKVDMRIYLHYLVEQLQKSLERDEIQIELDVSNDFLDVDHIIPLGIIVNELITNSFKHAFPEKGLSHVIKLKFAKKGQKYMLGYTDNGIGFDPKEQRNSLGLDLIETLVEQLNGELKFNTNDLWKTSIEIVF